LLPAAWAAPGARVAEQERRKTLRDLDRAGVVDAQEYLRRAERAVPAALGGRELTAAQLRTELPELDRKIHVAPGTKWGGEIPLMPRLLTILSADGRVVRAGNIGHWRQSRPRWTAMSSWLGGERAELPEHEGYAELVGRWLRTFGPGTETDLAWWLGSTKAAVRRALVDVEAVPVALDGDRTGWLLPDDLEPVPQAAPEAALLPVLDPTTMGWKERDFYLGDHGRWLFDSAGNGGNTAWWGGRIVGGWVQDGDDGRVRIEPLEPLTAAARRGLDDEAQRLTSWLGEVRLSTFFPSPQMLQARARR